MTADDLKTAQARAGMTSQELADALGVSLSTVVKWRGGQHAIPQPSAIAIRLITGQAAE